jgi:hypothetical protein
MGVYCKHAQKQGAWVNNSLPPSGQATPPETLLDMSEVSAQGMGLQVARTLGLYGPGKRSPGKQYLLEVWATQYRAGFLGDLGQPGRSLSPDAKGRKDEGS